MLIGVDSAVIRQEFQTVAVPVLVTVAGVGIYRVILI
jgi:hypothetical protein